MVTEPVSGRARRIPVPTEICCEWLHAVLPADSTREDPGRKGNGQNEGGVKA